MLLKKKRIIEGIIFPLIILYSCGEPQKPDSYIARVNNSYLTEEDLSELVDSENVSGESRSTAIKYWVRQEVLFQEAVKEGLTESKDYKKTINDTKRELASALLLEKYGKSSEPLYTNEDLEEYYLENKTSFKLPFHSYFLNRISFSDRNVAVQFRTDVIQNGWKAAVGKSAEDPSLVNLSNKILLPEQDIYPTRLLRVLEGLYPLEISIVIPDDRNYYTVVQLLDKYPAESVPPFEAVKDEVEKRLVSALIELNLENYISSLYSKNEIEIKN